MEQQHPIPQQISTYQFRLVGDMTLKQFFQVAGGALVALLFYSSGLASYVKWPFIILSFLIGVALAFFPLEDRPLSKWIVLFMKAIYSPTLYIWRKGSVQYNFFQPEPEEKQKAATQKPEEIAVSDKADANLEQGEKEFLTKVTQQFEAPPPIIPSLIRKRKPQDPNAPTYRPGMVGKSVKVPYVKSPQVELQEKAKAAHAAGEVTSPGPRAGITPTAGQKVEAQSAQFSPEAAPPASPTKPNLIVGQVLDSFARIIDAAILEIRDSEGRPVRALKTNKLGHFMIVTPLANGNYEIITEKEGYVFDPVSFEAKGEIIPPIVIRSKIVN